MSERQPKVLADEFDGFLIDLDGVVYVGGEPLPGAPETLTELRRRGTRILFLTNDPRSSRADYARKLRSYGIEVDQDEVITSGAATASYIAMHEEPDGRKAFVIGTDALKSEMTSVGLRVVEGDAGHDAGFVVVGGHQDFDYQELRIASQAVRAGALFFATNRDATFPMPDGPWPAVGAILAAVETASERRATVIGKPEPHMFEAAASLLEGCDRIAVVGDSLSTDIAGGRRAGLKTILVAAEEIAPTPSKRPDFIVRSLGGLLTGW